MRRARYMPRGIGALAIAAGAWGAEFDAPETARPFEAIGAIAVVDVRGPLTRQRDWLWDSYEAISARVLAALASPCTSVVLRMDSPGGDALGVFDVARELRAFARASQKPIIAYADGMIASAAYALACCADAIYVPEAGFIGSIGVVQPLVDATAMDRAMGLSYAVIASGARKTDGDPHVQISDAAIAEVQARVDALAELFFELVEESRGVPAASVRALEAAVLLGEKAVAAKLADGVMTFNELLAMVAKGGVKQPTAAPKAKAETAMNKEEMRAWLAKMAEGEGEEAEKAKAALKCLEEGDKPADEKKDDAPKEEAKAEDAPPPPEKKKDADGDNDAKALTLVDLAQEVHSLNAKLAKKDEDEERVRLLAKRPDFSPKVRATLMKAPMASLRDAVDNWERVSTGATKPALAASVMGTQGGGEGASQLPPDEARSLDERMGLRALSGGAKHDGKHSTFSAYASPEQAKAALKKGAVA